MRLECLIGLSTERYALPAAFHGRHSMKSCSTSIMAALRFIRFNLGGEPRAYAPGFSPFGPSIAQCH